MYIIAIGWLWVTFMMAITETSVVAGLMTFLFYGFLPCSLLLFLLGTPGRRRRRQRSGPPAGSAPVAPSNCAPPDRGADNNS